MPDFKVRPTVNGTDVALVDEPGMGLLHRAEAAWMAAAYTPGDTHLRDLTGNGHHARLGSADGADANDPLYLPFDGEKYLYLPGTDGNRAQTAAPVGFASTRLDWRIEISVDSWNSVGVKSGLIELHYPRFVMDANKSLGLDWLEGGAYRTVTSPAGAINATDGQRIALRVTVDGDTIRTFTFYQADRLAGPWTQIHQATDARAMDANSAWLRLGSRDTGLRQLWAGRIYGAEIRNEIDGPIVASFDPSRSTEPHTSFVAATGETWTINRSATGRKAALVDRPMFLFGGDDYMDVAHHSDLDFTGSDFTVALAFRGHGTATVYQSFLSKRSTTGEGWELGTRVSTGTARFTMLGADIDAAAAPLFRGSAWVLAGRASSGAAKIFDGGTEVGTGYLGFPNVTGDGPLVIGARYPSHSSSADMEFIGAAIFRRALTEDDLGALSRLFLSAHVPPTPHARTHATGGSDPITPAMIGAVAHGEAVDVLSGRQVFLRNAQQLMTGGGVKFTSGTTVSWSHRLIVMNGGRGAHAGTAGFFDITMPPDGTVIPGVGGASDHTVAGGVIAIPVWTALYYVLPIGAGNASHPGNFRLVGYSTSLVVPDDWVMVAQRNGEATIIRWGDGTTYGPMRATTLSVATGPLYVGGELVVVTSDARLTDQRVPTDGSVTDAKVSATAAIAESKLALASDAAATVASRRTLGTGATQAAPGNATVNLTGDQTVQGLKTFQQTPRIDHLLYGYQYVATLGDLDQRPRGVVERIVKTADSASGSSPVEAARLTAQLASDRLYRLSFSAIDVYQTVASDQFVLAIENLSTGAYLAQFRSSGAAMWPVNIFTTITGDNVNRVYAVRLRRVIGSGVGQVRAGSTTPAQFLIEDIGPAYFDL